MIPPRGRVVWTVSPLNVELNITRNVRIATCVGYRLAIAEKTEASQSRRDMAGIVARTSLVIGMF